MNGSEEIDVCASNAIEKLQYWVSSEFPPTPDTAAFLGAHLMDTYRQTIEAFKKSSRTAAQEKPW